MIGTTLGKYRLVSQLGSGGMAEVYKAFQPGLDRFVAVKVMHPHFAEQPGFIKRFEREAVLAARLRHPNIVQVFDFDVDMERDLYYMVMELIEGPTLATEIHERSLTAIPNRPTFSPIETVLLFNALASAVDYAHARNMIHRDLKPGNIMLTNDGQIILTDFGIARMVGDALPVVTSGRPAGTPIYMAPELCQGQPGDRASDIYALGIILYGLMTGNVPFDAENPDDLLRMQVEQPPPPPTRFNPELPAAVEQVILKTLAKRPEDRYPSAGALALALREALGVTAEQLTSAPPIVPRSLHRLREQQDFAETPPLTMVTLAASPPPCPYRGLFAFQEDDAPFFFGREDFTDTLSDRVESQQLTAVVGPSGSGKSSVVFAGLVSRLRQAPALRQSQQKAWLLTDMRPSARPFEALANAVLPPETPERVKQLQSLADSLCDGSVRLANAVKLFLRSRPDKHRLLLVIDQFEELFTVCPDPETRRAFIDVLLTGLDECPQLHIVLTMRADFLGQAFSHRLLADALQNATLFLGPMTRAELTRAIKEPARKQRVKFQSGLVERILDDVGEEPGNLPLLEFALTTLWAKQSSRLLTHQAYEEIGRVEGALARYAEEVYSELSAEQQALARRALVQLVRPGEGTEDTRRQATRAELEDAWPLVQQLANARLLVTNRDPSGQETAEIVHEALIRSWSRLREWMQANRNFRAWQERLRGMMQQWEAAGHDEGALLRGALLVGAEGWLAERESEIGQAERDFIRASIALREREAAEREGLRQREIEATRRLAEIEMRRAGEQATSHRQQRQRSLYLGLILALATVAVSAVLISGYWASVNIRRAKSQARLAQVYELAAQAQLVASTDPQLSLLLALHAASLTERPMPEVEDALRRALRAADPNQASPEDTPALLEAARRALTRTWTAAECRRYLRGPCPP
ncbi:MAG: protein kinase [Anaerolineales bacterium]|nr:protein kinase [Anaerolineales bacterium]